MKRSCLLRSVARSSRCVLCVFIIMQLGACGWRLRVVTEPPGSMVSVKDAAGRVVRAAQAAPAVAGVNFDRSERYIVEVEPGAAEAEHWEARTEEVTGAQYDALPLVGSQTRELKVRLPEKEYQQIRVVRLILDPERGWLGFLTEERAYRDVVEQGGAVPTRVVEFEEDDLGITGMALDPSGEQIVFALVEYDLKNLDVLKELRLDEHRELPVLHANLHGVRVTGGGIQHITAEDFQDMYPSFTQDGRYLLFCSNRRRPDSTDILRTSADGRGGISDVYVDQRGARAVKPSLGRDGTIAFAVYPPGWSRPADVRIWTTGGPNRFPTQIARGIQPQISPDGDCIAYVGNDGNLWVVDADGKNATQLTLGANRILERFREQLTGIERAQFEIYESRGTIMRHYRMYAYPSWSPDGERILFTSMEGNDPTGRPNEDIWIMNRDGTNKQQLTTNGSVDRHPLMSPDGRYVYFMSNRGLKWAIWRIAAP